MLPLSIGAPTLIISDVYISPKGDPDRVGSWDHTKYAGHSFRRGGASLALACNLPTELIKLQGDWRSDCYQRYLDPDLDTKFTVADAMAKKVGLLTKL